MALHTDLAIYQSADALFDLVLDMQKHIPREYRLVVGQKLANEVADILLLVGRANKAMDGGRLVHLVTLAESIEAASVLLRGAHRKRAISTTLWARSVELTTALGKQCTGWRKDTRQRLGLRDDTAPDTSQAPTAPSADLFSATPAA